MLETMKEVLWVIWRNEEGKSFKIGELCRNNCKYYFKYESTGLKLAKECGFELLPSFPKEDSEYFREELFRVFSERLGGISKKGLNDILKNNNIKQEDLFSLLRVTGGKSTKDTIEIVAPEEEIKETEVL